MGIHFQKKIVVQTYCKKCKLETRYTIEDVKEGILMLNTENEPLCTNCNNVCIYDYTNIDTNICDKKYINIVGYDGCQITKEGKLRVKRNKFFVYPKKYIDRNKKYYKVTINKKERCINIYKVIKEVFC